MFILVVIALNILDSARGLSLENAQLNNVHALITQLHTDTFHKFNRQLQSLLDTAAQLNQRRRLQTGTTTVNPLDVLCPDMEPGIGGIKCSSQCIRMGEDDNDVRITCEDNYLVGNFYTSSHQCDSKKPIQKVFVETGKCFQVEGEQGAELGCDSSSYSLKECTNPSNVEPMSLVVGAQVIPENSDDPDYGFPPLGKCTLYENDMFGWGWAILDCDNSRVRLSFYEENDCRNMVNSTIISRECLGTGPLELDDVLFQPDPLSNTCDSKSIMLLICDSGSLENQFVANITYDNQTSNMLQWMQRPVAPDQCMDGTIYHCDVNDQASISYYEYDDCTNPEKVETFTLGSTCGLWDERDPGYIDDASVAATPNSNCKDEYAYDNCDAYVSGKRVDVNLISLAGTQWKYQGYPASVSFKEKKSESAPHYKDDGIAKHLGVEPSGGIPIWVWIVSAVAGVLLLCCIGAGVYCMCCKKSTHRGSVQGGTYQNFA